MTRHDTYSTGRLRSRGRAICLVIVAVAVIGGILFMLVQQEHREEVPPPPPVSLTINTSGWTWQGFYGMSLPYSTQDGPLEVDAGRAAGFSRTPAGAFLAAVHILARIHQFMGSAIAEPTIARQVTGPEAGALLARVREDGLIPGWPAAPLDAPILLRVLAFRWVSYNPADAVLELITQAAWGQKASGFQHTRAKVRWVDDDWRLLAPRLTDPADLTTEIRSLAGYTQLTGGL